jgi:signal transduction histidine kinase
MAGVAAALLVVGVFQYHWMVQSAQAERERQTRVLVVSMIQTVRSVLPFLPPDLTIPNPLPAGPEGWEEILHEAWAASPFTDGDFRVITEPIFFPADGDPRVYREETKNWGPLPESPEKWEPVIRHLSEVLPEEPDAAALFLAPPSGEEQESHGKTGAVMGQRLPGGGTVVYSVHMETFLNLKIIPTLAAALPDYDITWSRAAPRTASPESRTADREFRREPRFSPWRALFSPAADPSPLNFQIYNDLVFRTSPAERGTPPFIGAFKPQFFGDEPPPGGIYLSLVPRNRSLLQEADRRLALNWVFSVLLLAGIGAAFFLVLLQGQRLRQQRLKEREFVASVTHELRTPLTVIRSAAQNLREGIVPESRRQKYGQLIEEQSQRLTRMVEGILLFSGLEGKKETPPPPASVDREALRQYLEDRIPPDPENGGPSREVLFDWGGLPRSFTADGEGLELILGNLLTNALVHTGSPDGPVKIKGRTRLPAELVFTVEDGGPGLPPREQKRLFTPFFRGGRSRENQIPGSGLGLYLSHRRAVLAGGSLTLESPRPGEDGKPRRGCRFTLILPFGEVTHG